MLYTCFVCKFVSGLGKTRYQKIILEKLEIILSAQDCPQNIQLAPPCWPLLMCGG